MHRVPAGPPQKVYQPPKLLIYGDLSEMTKQGGKGNPDRTKGNSMT
jgi:hypothetical protein